MEINIWPRGANDKGGIALMPMYANIPKGHKTWELVSCPKCGAKCWKVPDLDVVIAQGAEPMCTMCGLKAGLGGQ